MWSQPTRPSPCPDHDARRLCHARCVSELLLVHGGLWGESDADRFWRAPGVVAALEDRGARVIAPDRPPRPRAWRDEVGHLAAALRGSVCVVAGSNGCSVGVLLALAHPELVDGLVLAWPATAGDVDVDAWTRSWLAEGGADASVADALLAGETVRGVSDAEVALWACPSGSYRPPRAIPSTSGARSTRCVICRRVRCCCPAVLSRRPPISTRVPSPTLSSRSPQGSNRRRPARSDSYF